MVARSLFSNFMRLEFSCSRSLWSCSSARTSYYLSVLLCVCRDVLTAMHQEVIHAATGNLKSLNHGCPSWFIPISNSSDQCKCGEPIHRPGRVVLCDPNTNQTLVRISYCMDYNEEEDVVFVGGCPFINKKGKVHGMYVKFPQNVSELNTFLCSGLNRTGVMCSQCQVGLGTAIHMTLILYHMLSQY